MTQGEYLTGLAVHGGVGGFAVTSMLDLFRAHGLDEAKLEALGARGNAYRRGVPEIPASFRPMVADEKILVGQHSWQVIVGRGHAPEHAGLYSEHHGALISGDMLLPRISTNISVWSVAPEANPLAWFLASIDRLRALPHDTLVLPSHGRPFRGLHARVAQLETHHRERCAELLVACDRPKTAAELLPVLFPREISDAHQTMFAMGEAIAHLNYLEQARQLERITENGTIRFIRN
jgi:glyoxylase-like metal-dependent hydrolase (beta-lactamase superfamily II)